mgnify:CR=1 FL=1
MNLPQPDAAFRWSREPWGAALRCRSLDQAAQHLFTSKQLALPDPESWRQVTASLGATPDRLMRVRQVHGNVVRVLKNGEVPADAAEQRPDGDDLAVRHVQQPGLQAADGSGERKNAQDGNTVEDRDKSRDDRRQGKAGVMDDHHGDGQLQGGEHPRLGVCDSLRLHARRDEHGGPARGRAG